MNDEFSIAAIVVTYNRIEKLKIALASYEGQTHLPKRLIVVDNCSTDGTAEFLAQWIREESAIEKEVVALPANLGGAGGFQNGFERFLAHGDCQWAWVADDDAYPENDAFEVLCQYYSSLDDWVRGGIAALAAAVINQGSVHNAHRNHIRKSTFRWIITAASDEDYRRDSFEFDVFSYVGTMIKRSVLEEAGITRGDYFIYGDDQEHSLRVGECGRLICVPSSHVIHDTDGFGVRAVGWGHYYHVRNYLVTRREHLPSRYFWLAFIRGYIKNASLLSGNSLDVRKMYRCAYKDGLHRNMGCNKVYRPGFAFH